MLNLSSYLSFIFRDIGAIYQQFKTTLKYFFPSQYDESFNVVEKGRKWAKDWGKKMN